MKRNMGNLDRSLRSLLALVILALYAMDVITGTLGIALITLSAIFLLTSFISFCPLYAPFGVLTCRSRESEA